MLVYRKEVVFMIYLDNAATTKIDPHVLSVMMPYMQEEYGNPGGLYELGRKASDAVQKARCQVAALIKAEPDQIIFTSGGSEANSLVFNGLKDHLLSIGKTHILVSAIEHESVLKAAESLIKYGFDVEYIPPTKYGRIEPDSVRCRIKDNTGIVSVMHINNETGVMNDVRAISAICSANGILFHTDCVQAAGAYSLNVGSLGCDFMSISSHKIYGPKGVGALYVKDKSALSPIVYGGSSQEFGLRGGTENVAGVVGFGEACAVAPDDPNRFRQLYHRAEFFHCLESALKKRELQNIMHVNGEDGNIDGKVLNVSFDGIDNETLLLMLDTFGVYASAGSACQSHEAMPSHVLTAMGMSPESARSSVRFSFSKYNTSSEIRKAAIIVACCIDTLRIATITKRDGKQLEIE